MDHEIKYQGEEITPDDIATPLEMVVVWALMLAMCAIWFVGAYTIAEWI